MPPDPNMVARLTTWLWAWGEIWNSTMVPPTAALSLCPVTAASEDIPLSALQPLGEDVAVAMIKDQKSKPAVEGKAQSMLLQKQDAVRMMPC